VALDDDYAFVGAAGSNEVIAYRLGIDGQPIRVQTLRVPQTVGFGAKIVVDGELLFVSAYDASLPDAAASVSVFSRASDGSYYLADSLRINNVDSSDEFGASLAAHAGRVVVGAPGKNRAYYFERNSDGAWVNRREFYAYVEKGARYGASVAISHDYVAISAPLAKSGGGMVYVFRGSGSEFRHHQHISSFDPEFGASLSMLRMGIPTYQLVIGAPSAVVGRNGAQGKAHIWRLVDDQVWTPLTTITQGSNGRAGDAFGSVVDQTQDTILVGAPLDDSDFVDQGTATFFRVQGEQVSQVNRVSALSE
jgi:hypothetical protein